jgi:UDP-glucose 4-epimerase
MNILVTGGAGFIGSHIVDAYIEAGHDVTVVDDLSSGRRENVNPAATFHELSVLDDGLRDVFHSERPDIVNHHAAQISVVRSLQDPSFDARVNILGSIRLIECALEFGTRRFIFASTGGALYGEPESIPCDEAHPIAPLSPYGTAKYAVEMYLKTYRLTRGFSSACLRYSNVYGPRQDPHGEAGVVAIFAERMLANSDITIFGDGHQARDFLHVEDVVRANLRILDSDLEDVLATGLTVNLGTGVETSVNDIFGHLSGALGYHRAPVHEPERPGDVYRIALDASKARRVIGWKPDVDLEEGLKRTAEWFRNRPGDQPPRGFQ